MMTKVYKIRSSVVRSYGHSGECNYNMNSEICVTYSSEYPEDLMMLKIACYNNKENIEIFVGNRDEFAEKASVDGVIRFNNSYNGVSGVPYDEFFSGLEDDKRYIVVKFLHDNADIIVFDSTYKNIIALIEKISNVGNPFKLHSLINYDYDSTVSAKENECAGTHNNRLKRH